MCNQATGNNTCEVWEVRPLPRPLLKFEKAKYQNLDSTPLYLLTTNCQHDPCSPNEKQGKEDLGQKRLSDNTKVEFGATKDHG